MKVWAISSGEYSYYAVERIFTTKELAEEYIGGEHNSNTYFIEEFELHDSVPPRQLLWKCRAFASKARPSMEPILSCAVEPDMDKVLPELEVRYSNDYGEDHFLASGTDREAVYRAVAERYAFAMGKDAEPMPESLAAYLKRRYWG